MWDARDTLEALDLAGRERILDVGCGTGELTRVLQEESDARIAGLDADPDLLAHVRAADDRVVGDATRLPFADDTFDLVVCQALLINLPDPVAAVEEFARVSSDRVAAIEPDNSRVAVESSVDTESALATRARDAYIAGVETNVALGADTNAVLANAGLRDVTVHRHDLTRVTEPPYSEADLTSARRKATAARLEEQRHTLRRGGLTPEAYGSLREAWREMGRTVVQQMREGTYRRRSITPFYVAVGRV
jgi:SAM-dependent methyltransferase